MQDSPRFELIEAFKDQSDLLPTRATKNSAGYDFVVAQQTLVPSLTNQFNFGDFLSNTSFSLNQMADITKKQKCRPTLVPTGVKAYIPEGMYLQLSVRSSCPLKYWLILANGVGIIDSDYYNNPDNEGAIYFQIINLFPQDIMLQKGDKIGQGIFLPYYTIESDRADSLREGGFGSTGT